MNIGTIAALVALASAIPAPLHAETPAELIFAEGVLEPVATGQVLVYDHSRAGPPAEGFRVIDDGSVRLALQPTEDGKRAAIVSMLADGRARELNPFPPTAGNPILMTFMESNLRAMAQITGGSPFYIRNRMREALRSAGAVSETTFTLDGAQVPAQKVTFHPFEGDPNIDRMGAFAELEISFVISPAIPGFFGQFAAFTADQGAAGFRETITFQGVSEAE